MTKDLEETLAELGPGYREVVDRLVVECRLPTKGQRSTKDAPTVVWLTSRLSPPLIGTLAVAASILVFLGLGVFFREPTVRGTSDSQKVYTVAYASGEKALASILASQRPDGSWDNDFITRQNAAALRHAQGAEMLVAYKKAVRYLKSRGLRPLSDAELKLRRDEAARILAAT